MFGKKKKPSHSWEHKVLAGVETARDWTAPKLGAAADWAEGAYRKSAPKVQDASARALGAVNDGASVAGQKIKELSSQAGDGVAAQYDKLPKGAKAEVEKALKKYEKTQKRVKNEYVPAAGAKLGGYADRTAKLIHKAEVDPRVEKALIKATGDKKIVKKLRKQSEQYAKDAAKVLKKQQKSKARRKGLLIFGLVAAGVTAGVAAWRASQPVEDPWKKPEPVSKPAPATSAEAKPAEKKAEEPKDGTANVNAQPADEPRARTSRSPSRPPETSVSLREEDPQFCGSSSHACDTVDPMLSVLIGKAARGVSRIRGGGGSAFPGLVVEKLDRNFLARTLKRLPRGVIVVSGTNGKTTTTKMVVELLQGQG